MENVKWGFIGCGDVTEIKSGPAFSKIDNSEVIMVMRRDIEKAKDYANRHNIPGYTNDVNEIIMNPEINAVYIATPPSSHCEYTIMAAKAKKHVYVEKPMAVSYDECEKMVSACKDNGVKLFVAYYRRELEYFKKIEQVIRNHDIGKILSVNIRLWNSPSPSDLARDKDNWRTNPQIAGAGYFYDLASHQFDFLDLLLGPIIKVAGFTTNAGNLYDAEDNVTAAFQFENGIIGTGSWSFFSNENLDSTEIIGTKGKIKFSSFGSNQIELTVDSETKIIFIDHPKHVQQPLIETVVGELQGDKICRSTGLSGARTNWVMEQILKS